MPSSAFVLTASTSFKPVQSLSSSTFLSTSPILHAAPHRNRRARVQANAETDEKQVATTTEPTTSNTPAYEPPSLDTEVFSKFVDSAQERLDKMRDQVQNIDSDQVLANMKDASIGLIDNILAGDWLNRGELYGAIQLAFVLFLLRAPGGLDALVSFVCGPLVLFAGAAISGKSLWDLGRKQLSIWPAPVPDAELQTDGAYEYVRHPMYSGLILASIGFSISTGSPARLAITIAFALFLAKKIEVEEDFLMDTYPEYASYCDKVKNKILPGIY